MSYPTHVASTMFNHFSLVHADRFNIILDTFRHDHESHVLALADTQSKATIGKPRIEFQQKHWHSVQWGVHPHGSNKSAG